jgi:glycine cleavage system H protein
MKLPETLRYTASHEWVRTEPDGTVTVGITDHAQQQLGDVVYVELPEVGRQCTAGQACAVIESVKAASDIYAPLAGEIVAVNETLRERPESVNEDAYAAWMYRMKPADPGAVAALLDADGYRQSIG